jgi:hypothetical protein
MKIQLEKEVTVVMFIPVLMVGMGEPYTTTKMHN